MPKADVILWILKGDDRAYGADLECYKKIIQPLARDNKIPIIFVLNQADKIAPSREWNIEESQPSVKQLQNINKKVAYVKEIFGHPSTRICAVAADENYGLISLVEKIVTALPAEKRYGFTREARSENVSEAAQSNAEHGIWKTVKDYTSKLLEKTIEVVIKTVTIALIKKFFS